MLKIVTTLSMLLAGLLAQAQSTETQENQSFSRIETGKGIELILTESGEKSAEIKTDAKIMTTVVDNTLRIDNAGGSTAKVYVSARAFEAVSANGSSVRITNQISAKNFQLFLDNASFSGNINSENVMLEGNSGSVFNVRVSSNTVNGNFYGNSKVNLSGNAKTANITTQSEAFCNARNFITDNVVAEAEGNSKIIISAVHEISVDVNDKAKVTYLGEPKKVSLSEDSLALNNAKAENRLLTGN